MCDIFGLCDGERTRKNGKYEWLGEEERPNAAAIEALRRQQYSRDLELPERIDRGGAHPKRFIPDKVLDLGVGRAGGADTAACSSTGAGGGSVYKRGDRAEESSEREPPAKQSAAMLSAGGQRLGGDASGMSEAADEEAHAKAGEAALKRLEATPQGFSADGLRKLKQAAGAQK
jgi:hypothetical protein